MFILEINPEGIDMLSRSVASIVFEKVKDLLEIPKNEGKYLTSKEAAKLLQISLPTLADYTKQELIPSYRISTTVRYKQSDIDEAITKGLRKYSARKGGKL